MVKSNSADAFKVQYQMLHLAGVWPDDNPSVSYKIGCASSWILSVGIYILMGVEVVSDASDYTKLSETLYVFTNMTAYLVKLIVITYQGKVFLKALSFLREAVFASYPDELDHYMVETIRRSTIIANIMRYSCLCLSILYSVYPIVDNKPLPFPFPYDLGRYRYPVYVFEIAAISCSAWNATMIDALVASFMGIGAAHLDILSAKIVHIIGTHTTEDELERRNEGDIIVKMRQCVEHHLAIITLIGYIETVFTVAIFIQFLAISLDICNSVLYCVMISSQPSQVSMLANYVMIVLGQLTLYCWYGNEIILKSDRVREACYNSEWYNCGNEVRKCLFIIMERSKRPISVSVCKLSTCSLRAYMSILQWSYSCAALLLKMYGNRVKAQ